MLLVVAALSKSYLDIVLSSTYLRTKAGVQSLRQ